MGGFATRTNPQQRVVGIDCSNLSKGGGVAVAASFLRALEQHPLARSCRVVISPSVDKAWSPNPEPAFDFISLRVKDVRGVAGSLKRQRVFDEPIDIHFTLFGPNYSLKRPAISVTGFARPWIVYGDCAPWELMSRGHRARVKVQHRIAEAAFRRDDVILVEHSAIKAALARRDPYAKADIRVIENGVDPCHVDASLQLPLMPRLSGRNLRLGLASRDYPHKNLEFLVGVKDALHADFGRDCDIYVTLSNHELKAHSKEFQSRIINVGSLAPRQVADFYRQVDGAVMPSLLECFSAAPLEALAAGKPVFCSDRPFFRDVMQGNALYFDPYNPQSAAQVISEYFCQPVVTRESQLAESRRSVLQRFSADQRSAKYVQLLQELLESLGDTRLHPS